MRKIVPNDAVLIPDEAVRVFKGVFYDVYHWSQKLFDGSTATFEMLKRKDSAKAICVVDDRILILEEEQPKYGTYLNVPGGLVENGDAEQTARREAREETGYEFKNWRLLHVRQAYEEIEWFFYVFLAWNGSRVSEPKTDAGEKISVKRLELGEVKSLVLNNEGRLGHYEFLFEKLQNIEDLMDFPEFVGKEVDR